MYEQRWVVDAVTAVIAVVSVFVALSPTCWLRPARNTFIAFCVAAVLLSLVGNGWSGLGVALLYVIVLYKCGDRAEESIGEAVRKGARSVGRGVDAFVDGANAAASSIAGRAAPGEEAFTVGAKHAPVEHDMLGLGRPVAGSGPDSDTTPLDREPMDEDALRRFITPELLDAAQGKHGGWPSPADA